VYQVFENVAKKYDVMNDSMTLGVHRVWKDILVHKMNPCPGTLLLDVAGGTGDIALRFINYVRSVRQRQLQRKLKHHQNLSWQEIFDSYQKDQFNSLGDSQVVVCDINKEMLKVGKQRAQRLGYSEVRILFIPLSSSELHDNITWHDNRQVLFYRSKLITSALSQALQEAYRVLKPGGRFLCLEFSHVSNPLVSRLYDLYSFQVIPVLGEVIAGDWRSYQYLVESIRQFPPQEELKAMIEDAGFFKVDYENLNCGIVAIHSGFKL
ncbi:COQ5 protein, partial [Illadopsis cleaveri]|nr:COQ5 protein [Illadopsis cleaveri]